MLRYIADHWNGRQSLAWSFFVNGLLVGLAMRFGIESLAVFVDEGTVFVRSAASAAAVGALVVVGIWQIVGLFRAARHSGIEGSAVVARSVQFIAIASGTLLLGAAGIVGVDLYRTHVALSAPDMSDFTVARSGEVVHFAGAINDASAEAMIEAFNDPSARVLRIASPGGIVASAMRMSRFIEAKGIPVVADQACVSACVLVLAASPDATVDPRALVTFHHPQPLVDFVNPAAQENQRRETDRFFGLLAGYGVEPWALLVARNTEFWTPRLEEQIAMKLVDRVIDPSSGQIVAAAAYCGLGKPCAETAAVTPVDLDL